MAFHKVELYIVHKLKERTKLTIHGLCYHLFYVSNAICITNASLPTLLDYSRVSQIQAEPLIRKVHN